MTLLAGGAGSLAQLSLLATEMRDERKERGRRIIVQGIIALAVMVAVWALVAVLNSFVFGETNPSPFIPGNDIVDKI